MPKKPHELYPNLFFIVLGILFGFLLLFSGILKIYDLNAFELSIKGFSLIPDDLIKITSFIIPSYEILTGLFIIFKFLIKYSLRISVFIMSFFSSTPLTVFINSNGRVNDIWNGIIDSNKITEFINKIP